MFVRSGQPERFEAGGMDMDLGFDAVLQPDLGDPGLPDAAVPEDLLMDHQESAADALGTPGPLPVIVADPEGERGAQVDGAEVAGAAAQARALLSLAPHLNTEIVSKKRMLALSMRCHLCACEV